jgi:hypothetical protein
MLSVENRELEGGGPELKAKIWDAAVDSVREWTGQDLTTSSLYGIRVYKSGAVLAPHVDRLPLVSSCIINVAQVRALSPLLYGLVAAFISFFGIHIYFSRKQINARITFTIKYLLRTWMSRGHWRSMHTTEKRTI